MLMVQDWYGIKSDHIALIKYRDKGVRLQLLGGLGYSERNQVVINWLKCLGVGALLTLRLIKANCNKPVVLSWYCLRLVDLL